MNIKMDGTQSKPKFFERLISRLAGEPDSAEDVLTLLRQAHEQEVFDADTLTRLEKVLDFAELEVRDAMITRSRMNVLKEKRQHRAHHGLRHRNRPIRVSPSSAKTKTKFWAFCTPKTCSNICLTPSSST